MSKVGQMSDVVHGPLVLYFSRSALVQDVLYDARVYSYYLSTLWNVTTCDTNTLVLYSRDDDIVSTHK